MDDKAVLTTRQGHPVRDNQSMRTVGERGPATLENYQFIEKITHFDRERIPERVVHARGAGAHGWFEAYGKIGDEPASKYTRARVLNETGVKTPMFVRFSTVAGAKESPETERDPRGFAVKFKTLEGNWDLVGNNLKIFFIRDAIKFPDMIHAFKPDPVTNRQEAWRFFDFIAGHPESLHMVTWLKSPWGIPANYREMEGSGVNTYKLVNAEGRAYLCKFHWIPKQGVRNLTSQQAAEIQGKDVGHSTRDLYDNISKGNFPEWEFACRSCPTARTSTCRSIRSTTPSAGRKTSSRCCRSAAWCSTACRTTSSPMSNSRPSARACWSTASISRTTRCCRVGRCPIPTRSAIASARTTCSCRSTLPSRASRSTPTSVTAR